MISNRLFSEIFEEFSREDTKAGRLAVLRKYDHPRLREFLIYAFNPAIQFDVEVPKYKPAVEPAGLNFAYLDSEMSKMYRFIKGHPLRSDGLSPNKQKQLLLVTLESLHKDEADLLVKLIKKDLGIKYLTKALIEEAYPGI